MTQTPRVDLHVLSITPVTGVPILIASGVDPSLDPEDIRDIAEQLREQVGTEFRVVVVSGMLLERAHHDMALDFLRALEAAWTHGTPETFAEQWTLIRSYLQAVDTPPEPADVSP